MIVGLAFFLLGLAYIGYGVKAYRGFYKKYSFFAFLFNAPGVAILGGVIFALVSIYIFLLALGLFR